MFEVDEMQAKALEYRGQAHKAADGAERERCLGMARSYVLLSMNAAWIKSTDHFLRAVEKKQPWPQPSLAEDQVRDSA